VDGDLICAICGEPATRAFKAAGGEHGERWTWRLNLREKHAANGVTLGIEALPA
jgi:hypothetical protein